MVVWRCALWHPELISNVFVVCTPYTAPSETYISTLDLVKGPLPQFGYQIHLASPEVENNVTTKEQIRQFLNGMYGGRTPKGKAMLSPENGVLFEQLPMMGQSKLINERVCRERLVSHLLPLTPCIGNGLLCRLLLSKRTPWYR